MFRFLSEEFLFFEDLKLLLLLVVLGKKLLDKVKFEDLLFP
jgi:hypothetical protein